MSGSDEEGRRRSGEKRVLLRAQHQDLSEHFVLNSHSLTRVDEARDQGDSQHQEVHSGCLAVTSALWEKASRRARCKHPHQSHAHLTPRTSAHVIFSRLAQDVRHQVNRKHLCLAKIVTSAHWLYRNCLQKADCWHKDQPAKPRAKPKARSSSRVEQRQR